MRLKNLTFLLTMVLSVASCIGWSGTGDSEEYVCVAAFEEYSSQMGADSILTAAQIFNYDLIFTAKVDEAEGYQGGTMLSKRNDSTVYSVYGEGGAFDSDVYAVFYENPSPSRMPAHDILFYRSTLGTCRLHGCMVNNTRQTVDAIINGSGSMRKFEEGDWLKLTATGYNDSTETASKSIYLAQYTERMDSVVTTWTKFDWTELGDVDYVDLKLSSNRSDYPRYFCYDYVVASVAVQY